MILILPSKINPSGYSVNKTAILDSHFNLQCRKIEDWNVYLARPKPKFILRYAIVYLRADILSSFPLVKLAKNRDVLSLRRPLSIDIDVSFLVHTISLVTLRNIIKAIFSLKLR
jgi:hypothetical protein